MVCYEFTCGGMPSLFVITPDPDPARIPDAAQVCCQAWRFVREFETGDGSHSPALDAAIVTRVTADGYHIYSELPAGQTPQRIPRKVRAAYATLSPKAGTHRTARRSVGDERRQQ